MPTPTNRLNLLKPEQSDDFVTEDIADNWQKLDDGVALYSSGSAGSRPSAGVAGRLYFATDTNAFSWDTGSTWLSISHATLAALTTGDPHTQYLLKSGGTLSGQLDLNRQTLRRPLIRDYREPVQQLGNVSGSVTLDLTTAHVFVMNPTGSVTINFSGLPSSSSEAANATLVVNNSSHSLSWPSFTEFRDGEPPELDGKTWLSIAAIGGTVTVLEAAKEVSA